MFYHLALLAPPAQREAFREGVTRQDELRRAARRARRDANRQLVHGALAKVGTALRRLAAEHRKAIRRRRAEAETVRELQGLSDLALKDIGLQRSDIRRIAEALAQAEPLAAQSAALTQPVPVEAIATRQTVARPAPAAVAVLRPEARTPRPERLSGRRAVIAAGPTAVVTSLRGCA